MNAKTLLVAGTTVAIALAAHAKAADSDWTRSKKVKHVLLLSIDGMHAVDFYNCSKGAAGVNNGDPYCPNMAALSKTAINYVGAISSKPSDSFPGIAALVTGGSPKTTGIYYDVAFERSLDPPAITTGTGLAGGTCTPYAAPTGTTTDYDQGIELDDTMLNGGAPGASLTDGGIASIDPKKLVRDPKKGCAPVYPWDFVRTNTIFGVVHEAGGYTAWIDKHASYAMVGGPGGKGLNDYYSPEVDSTVVGLPGVKTAQGASCATIRDSAGTSSWTSSFDNIQCYDALKVDALLKQIDGRTHTGAAAKVPEVFGMNFQAVYIGQSVSEPGVGQGGYQNAAALPSAELLKEIEFVDASIGDIVNGLKKADLYNDTLIIITAKHGESPIDPNLYMANGSNTPATLLANMIPSSESPLNIGGLERGEDSRTPDIIVTPNIGQTYSGSTTMIGDHGGFGHDDTNVVMLVAHPSFTAQTVSTATTTSQVAPTILKALGLDPKALDAVRAEGTLALPEVKAQLAQ